MIKKTKCPECGRQFSEHLVKFPMLLDDNNKTMVYFMCSLCALERINKAQGLPVNTLFKKEYSRKLYKEALREIEVSGQRNKKKPTDKKDIKLEQLVKLTPQEYEKVIKRHPELADKDN